MLALQLKPMTFRPAPNIDSYCWKTGIILTCAIAVILLTSFFDEGTVVIFHYMLDYLQISFMWNIIQTST